MGILLIGAFLLGLLVGRKNSINVSGNTVYLTLEKDIEVDTEIANK